MRRTGCGSRSWPDLIDEAFRVVLFCFIFEIVAEIVVTTPPAASAKTPIIEARSTRTSASAKPKYTVDMRVSGA